MADNEIPENHHFMSRFHTLPLWDVAHRWAGKDPRQADPNNLDLLVQDILLRLMFAQIDHDLSVCTSHGVVLRNWNYIPNWRNYHPVQDNWDGSEDHRRELYYDYMDELVKRHNDLIERYDEIIEAQKFDKKYLSNIRIDRQGLVEWCLKTKIPLPGFWIGPESEEMYRHEFEEEVLVSERVSEVERDGVEVSDEKYDEIIESVRSEDIDIDRPRSPRSGKMTRPEIDDFWGALMDQQKTRLICRELASALWKHHPDMTIAEIEKHDLISKYAGGLAYSGRATIRNWIKDLDPRPLEQKIGRPKSL